MTGSKLCARSSGQVLWGDSRRFLAPWDGGYRLTVPITGAIDDDIEPCGAILEIRIAQWRKDIYGGLFAFMQRSGYTIGNLHDPRAEGSFFFFDHDWRRDNAENARLLAIALRRVAVSRGDGRVHLICQSNAAYICRYLVKYGDVSLDEAESGLRRPPAGVKIEKVIFVGTANGGAIRILQELNRGRQYVRVIGRRWRQETFFTFRSLFQDLPVYRTDLFVDAAGKPMTVDLFDPENWRKYGWSIFAPDVDARLQRTNAFGTPAERDVFLREALESARRLHNLLRRDNGAELPRYYSIQSRELATPARAALARQDGRWRTLFLLTAEGDRHATIESQQWLSPEESAALASPPIYVRGRHFEMITTAETRSELIRILHAE